MSKNKVAFLTVVFPMPVTYLYAFFNSLMKQTYRSFDIVVINDGFQEFDQVKDRYKLAMNIIDLKFSGTPAQNREYGINYCIERSYDVLIFGDADDFFEKNRVEVLLRLLRKNDIVVNDLHLYDDNRGVYRAKYFTSRLNDLEIISFDFIKDKNIFGFTNTGIKLSTIKDKITLPEDLIAVDWYFFSVLLLLGNKAIFTNQTATFYRQHAQNIVGLAAPNVQLAAKVKRIHYNHLVKLTDRVQEEAYRMRKCEKVSLKGKSNKDGDTLLWWEV